MVSMEDWRYGLVRKVLGSKHKALSLELHLGMQRRQRQKGPELCWVASLAESFSYGSTRETLSKNTMENNKEGHLFFVFGLYMHMLKYSCTPLSIHAHTLHRHTCKQRYIHRSQLVHRTDLIRSFSLYIN